MSRILSILVPTDFSPPSRLAAGQGVALAARFNARLDLLHVLAPTRSGGHPRADRDSAHQTLADIAATAPPETPTQCLIREGDAADTIAAVARELDTGLVVMSTHGAGTLRRLLFGSIASKVLHDTECPVLTGVHLGGEARATRGYSQVACGLGFDARDPALLEWGDVFATAYGATLSVLHTMSNAEQWSLAARVPPNLAQSLTVAEWRQHMTDDVVGRLRTLAREAGVTARVIAELADIEHALPDLLRAEGVDLLVVGRTHRDEIPGRFGGHTYTLIREAPCDVLCV